MKNKTARIIISLILGYNLAIANDFKDGFEAFNKGDFSKAAELLTTTCTTGDAKSCHHLGFLYQAGKGVELNNSKAAEYYAKACDGGDANGCQLLGFLYSNGQGVEQNNQKSLEFLSKACDGGLASV